MSTVLSALVVLGALTASGVLLVQLAVSESRRSRRRAGLAPPASSLPQTVPAPVEQLEQPLLPELAVPPPPIPRVRPAPVPVAGPAAVQPAAYAPTLSPDGAWLWTGSAWVPAWWGGPTVPPPPSFAVMPPPRRPARSHGCAAALGMGCAVVITVVALIVLGVAAASSGLLRLSGG